MASDAAIIRLGRSLGAFAVIVTTAGFATLVVGGHREIIVGDFVVETSVFALGFGAFLLLAVPAQPRNAAVWMPGLGAFFGALFVAAEAVLIAFITSAGIDSSELSDLPVSEVFSKVNGLAVVPLTVVNVTGVATFFLVIASLAFFPVGKLLSPRWRWLIGVAVADMVVIAALLVWVFRPDSDILVGADGTGYGAVGQAMAVAEVVLLLLGAAAVASLLIRFRRSEGVVRQQIRWIIWGGSTLIAGLGWELVRGAATSDFGLSSQIPTIVGELVLIGSYGVAITRYRLYDIDVVISRTVVYGLLAAFIGAVYVGLVVGIGSLVGGTGGDPNPVLAIVATALVAVLFQPLRIRLQKIANRIVYGKRATPYEVLSEFSRQVAATDGSLLEPVARSLVEGTTAAAAAIWALGDGRSRVVSAWPDVAVADISQVLVRSEQGELSIDGFDVVLPIVEGGELLGALALSTAPGQALNAPDMELARELASGVALTLRNMRLTGALEERVTELRSSRKRIVALQDETRRSLERDLHDGAQQRLVAMKVKLALAGRIASNDGAVRTATFLHDLSAQADQAITELREFARGIYPPLLEAEGLEAALRSEAQRLGVVVDVATEGVGRYAKDLEATVYFCVLEALHNVVRHSAASSAQVTLHGIGDSLVFEVRDAGAGFDPDNVSSGLGILNMKDRVDAAGGRLTIESSPGGGTVVRGTVPTEARS